MPTFRFLSHHPDSKPPNHPAPPHFPSLRHTTQDSSLFTFVTLSFGICVLRKKILLVLLLFPPPALVPLFLSHIVAAAIVVCFYHLRKMSFAALAFCYQLSLFFSLRTLAVSAHRLFFVFFFFLLFVLPL